MRRGSLVKIVAGLFYLLAVIFGLNMGGFLHGCGEEDTYLSDAEFEVGGKDINVCKNNFDCPNGYVCEDGVCVKYGGDVLQDTGGIVDVTTDVTDISDVVEPEDAGVPVQLTIYDIQDPSSQDHPEVGTYIYLTGVVATSKKFVVSSSSQLNGFFVEEKNGGAYSGILLVGKSDILGDNITVEPGDEYDVWGYYNEFKGENDTYSNSEIEVARLELRQRGSPLPAPVRISDPATIATGGSDSERYQGVLVEINNVTVTKEANTYGEWTVTGGLLVDDIFYSYKPPVGVRLSRLAGILHTAFNNYKLEPRDEGDIEVEMIDGGMDVIEDTGVIVKEVTIYDIQNVDSANHPQENEAIVVKNVVITAPTHKASASLFGVFVEEKSGGEYSGILVVYSNTSGLGPFTIGDEITVEGSYKEFNDLTEIVATNIIKVGTTTPPAPEVVDPSDIATGGAKAENYEGVLVKVEGVEVIDANPDAPNDYKEFAITGGLRVDDLYSYDYTEQRNVGDKFDYIIGILHYSFGNFKIEPRGNEDLRLASVGPDAGEDVISDVGGDVVEDGGQDVIDAGGDAGAQPDCDGIVKHIVISEVATRGQTAYDEFVELYNPLTVDMDISEWKLQYKSSTGTAWNDKLVIPAGTVIKAHGYLLVAADHSDYQGPTPDLRFSGTGLADNGHIRIVNKVGVEVDKIGFSSTDPEGSPATIPCTTSPCSKSSERKARGSSTAQTMASGGVDEFGGNGYDTDDNVSNFIVRESRDPQNSQNPTEDHGCFDCTPSGEELCDGVDNDCDGMTDADDPTLNLDCEMQLGVCGGARHSASDCVGGGWVRICDATEYGSDYSTTERCDGLDNNCDGSVDEDFVDLGQPCEVGVGECKRSGLYVCKADKSGVECNAVPGTPTDEVCDGLDNNCDGSVDEGENNQGCSTYYYDADGDGYYLPNAVSKCLCSPDVVNKFTGEKDYDCDDEFDYVNPSATEVLGNGIDDDCDGTNDENSTYTIGWANTQYPTNFSIRWGDPTGDIYGRVYVAGLTDAFGDPNLIQAKIGIAPADYTSFSEFRYFPASYNPLCSNCGNNYEYMADVAFLDFYVPGKYQYVYEFAFSVDGGANWVYGLTNDVYYKNWIYINPSDFGVMTLTLTDHIVVSEFMVGGADTDDEFIEIYNPTSSSINVGNWKIRYSAAGTQPDCASTPVFTFPSDTIIQPRGYLLLAEANKTYAPIADFTQTAISLSGAGGHIFICDPSNNIIDLVGYGNASYPETATTSAPPDNSSKERKARATSTSISMDIGGSDEFLGNGYDSNNNSEDFVERSTPQPQNSSSPPEQ